MSKSKYYDRRKAAGVCVRCGQQDQRTESGLTLCQRCSGWDKRYVEAKIQDAADKKICVRCGGQDAMTLAGSRLCEGCLERQREHKRVWAVKYRKRLAADGRCTKCGAALPTGYEYATCPSCRDLALAYKKRKVIRE